MLLRRKFKMLKIQIKHNRFLDPVFWCHFQQRFKITILKRETQDEIDLIIKEYKETWFKNEKKILKAIQQITKLTFKHSLIDVHIVRRIDRSFSRPIIFDIRKAPENFCDQLTHELLHIILQENNNIVSWEVLEWLNERFPKESDTTRNHIFIHAVLKKIYINILKNPKRLKENMKRSQGHHNNDYVRAWEIVEEYGEDEIIKMFTKYYRSVNA